MRSDFICCDPGDVVPDVSKCLAKVRNDSNVAFIFFQLDTLAICKAKEFKRLPITQTAFGLTGFLVSSLQDI
jgi:hypothetical protein